MATQPDDGALGEVENLYMLLNVDRTADPKDIRAAYLRLASCLHPDKASNAAIRALSAQEQDGPVMDTGSRMASLRRVRQRADKQFVRVDRAYRVLADPVKKLIYDEYGLDALRAFEHSEMAKATVATHLKHPSQVRHLMDELLLESAQRRLEATLGMSGRISAECGCAPLFGADGELIVRNIFPEVTQLVVQQSVEVPLNEKSRLTFGGYALHRSGMGMGSTFLALQHNLSATKWMSSHLELGYSPKISASFGQTMDNGGPSIQVQMSRQESGLGYKFTTSKQLDAKTILNASFGLGSEDGVTLHGARFVRGGLGRVRGEVRMSGEDLGMRLSYQHFIKTMARSLQISCKLGNRGVEVEVGARRLLPRQVKMVTAMRVGLQGVSAVLRLQRGGMQFQVPVLLSAVSTGWTLMIGGVIPATIDAAVGWLLSTAWSRRAARLRAGEASVQRRRLRRAWKDAASQTALMRHTAQRSASQEAGTGGLKIIRARYGCRLSQDCGADWWAAGSEASEASTLSETGDDGGAEPPPASSIDQLISAPNVDVTVPLQFFVKSSSLILPGSSKSSLLGFYRPAPCRGSGRASGRPRSSWPWLTSPGMTLDQDWDEEWESGNDQSEGFFWGDGQEAGGSRGPTTPQLYIRYEYAGRLFEETFEDLDEVILPSPTSTYMGGDEVR